MTTTSAALDSGQDPPSLPMHVYVGDRHLSGEVQTGSSFLSQNDSRLHFGLADDGTYKRIEVQWPGGARETFDGGPANRIVTLKQGAGSNRSRPN